MMDGEVDGACGTPPLAVLAARQGAKIILPPDKTWPFNPSYGIIATEKLILGSMSLLEDFLMLHENACNLLREKPEEAARLVNSHMKIIDEDFAREVFRTSPKYCASLLEEYVDSAMAFVPPLREMRYLDQDLIKDEVFYTRVIEKVHPDTHHYAAQ